MQSVRVLIVEDERIAAEALQGLLSRDPEVEILGAAADGATAVAKIRELRPDIVFLDIQIPEIDGFGVIDQVGPAEMPLVVFVTAFDGYTLRAFEVEALDYLLKPFDEPRLRAALDRAKREHRLRNRVQATKLTRLVRSVAGQQDCTKRLPITSARGVVFVDFATIDYFEAAGNYVRVHAGAREYLTRETMMSFEKRLENSDFVRIHRSLIVNRSRIRELRPWFTGEYIVVLNTGKELTLSRGYRDRLPLLLTG